MKSSPQQAAERATKQRARSTTQLRTESQSGSPPSSDRRDAGPTPPWASVAMIAGGVLMIALWPIYTSLHGPTSFNEGGELLGLDPEFWGAMMEGPSLLLMAAGLFGSRWVLTEGAARRVRVGLVLALIGLVVPAIANIAILAVWPPLLAPLLGIALILIAGGQRDDNSSSRAARRLLIGMGITQIFSFSWALVVRPDLIDRIDGYRIAGIVANVLFGLLWILLGISLLTSRQAVDPFHDDAA